MKAILFVLALLATFSSLVSAWGIGLYSDEDCFKGNPIFDMVMYYGTNDGEEFSACITVGESSPDVTCWKRDPAGGTHPCDGPVGNIKGVYYTGESDCCVGFSEDCYYNTCSFHGDQCLWTDGMPGTSSAYVTFKCKRNWNPVEGKEDFNSTFVPIDPPK